jgi:alpha-glucosidase (family GH31 glycosyl hydrolase)
MRPMFFDHPGEPAAWAYPQQWMLGADLLVSPVMSSGVSTWPVWLPDGEWVDVWIGEPVRGGRVLERDVPIDVVPVWCRANAWSSLAPVFDRVKA